MIERIASKERAERYAWGTVCDGWHLARSTRLSVIQERVPPGCSEVRHLHQTAEQFFFVLRGVATIEVNGTRHVLHAEQGLHVHPGEPHRLFNESEQDLEFIVMSTPPSHGDRTNAEQIASES